VGVQQDGRKSRPIRRWSGNGVSGYNILRYLDDSECSDCCSQSGRHGSRDVLRRRVGGGGGRRMGCC